MTAAHINYAKIANVIQLSSFRKRSCERRLDGRSKSTLCDNQAQRTHGRVYNEWLRSDRLWRKAAGRIVMDLECPLLSGLCCESRFAEVVENSEDCWRVVGVMIWGTSSPHAKFIGDFGSATEAIRITDIFALQVFAKN
jgi:hypothetical protein